MIVIGDELNYRLRHHDRSGDILLRSTPKRGHLGMLSNFSERRNKAKREHAFRWLQDDWAEVTTYHEFIAHWLRLDTSWMDESESDAVDVVFECTIDSGKAPGVWTAVRGAPRRSTLVVPPHLLKSRLNNYSLRSAGSSAPGIRSFQLPALCCLLNAHAG